MIQFNFQFKRKFSGFNSKNYSKRKKCQDSIQKQLFNKKKTPGFNIQFKIILGQFNSIGNSIQ